MNYLLDTHAFLWSIFDSKKLSKKVSEIILNVDNNINVSLITFWEIALKYNIGKITLKKVLPEDLPSYAKKSDFEILNPTAEDVASFYKLPATKHKDPFDRMIIWQCIQNKIILLSKDTKLEDYENYGLKAVW